MIVTRRSQCWVRKREWTVGRICEMDEFWVMSERVKYDGSKEWTDKDVTCERWSELEVERLGRGWWNDSGLDSREIVKYMERKDVLFVTRVMSMDRQEWQEMKSECCEEVEQWWGYAGIWNCVQVARNLWVGLSERNFSALLYFKGNDTQESFLSKVAFESNLRKKLSRIEHVLILKVSFESRKITKVFVTHVQDFFRKSLSKATFERKLYVSLP